MYIILTLLFLLIAVEHVIKPRLDITEDYIFLWYTKGIIRDYIILCQKQ